MNGSKTPLYRPVMEGCIVVTHGPKEISRPLTLCCSAARQRGGILRGCKYKQHHSSREAGKNGHAGAVALFGENVGNLRQFSQRPASLWT